MDDQPDADIPRSLQAITIEEFAEALEVNPKTVKRWITDHELPALRFGDKLTRILIVDAEAFLDRHREQPDDGPATVRPIR